MHRQPDFQNEDLRLLPYQAGTYTMGIFDGYSTPSPVSVKRALNELSVEIVPFSERLSSYISKREGIECDVKAVKRFLRSESDRKGLSISSANLSQWFSSGKGEVNLSAQSVFKLCLAMQLDLNDSAHFVYDCLFREWFNYRVREECVYFFFIGAQSLFGDGAFAAAMEVIGSDAGVPGDVSGESAISLIDATGYTSALGRGMRDLLSHDFESKDAAVSRLKEYLQENQPLFTGMRRSAARCYETYLEKGGIGIVPLTELFNRQTGLTLPKTSYLDMSAPCSFPKSKRLLWGAANRADWISKYGRDWDILHESQIKTEHHAVERMAKNGYARGNIIALLFFHFCLEHANEFHRGGASKRLFERFYTVANLTLIDECGMMPLHPRKPFDALFLASLSRCGDENPIDYLNRMLERFYMV